jgi:hypothetical protein
MVITRLPTEMYTAAGFAQSYVLEATSGAWVAVLHLRGFRRTTRIIMRSCERENWTDDGLDLAPRTNTLSAEIA